MKKVFISGAISSRSYEEACKQFKDAQLILENWGYEVENPMEATEHLNPQKTSWQTYMRSSITQLMKCDYIYMLHGWERSKGANIEKKIAEKLDISALFTGLKGQYRDVMIQYVHAYLLKQGCVEDGELYPYEMSWQTNYVDINGQVIGFDDLMFDIDTNQPAGKLNDYLDALSMHDGYTSNYQSYCMGFTPELWQKNKETK